MATDEAKEFRSKALTALTEIQNAVKEAKAILEELKARKAETDDDDED